MAFLSLGYHLGARTAIPLVQLPSQDIKAEESDEEDEYESVADGNLSSIKAGFMEPCKLVRLGGSYHVYSTEVKWKVLVVRTDLKMTQGKISAQ